jgi:uncharacterized membrane protein YcaP (DUF421 family)
MLFDGWADLWRVGAAGALGYAAMVLELRIAGKRTLAKMNAFDLVVTVALGSVLATIALSRDVSLAEGVAAITVLVGAQWVVSWTSVRTSASRHLMRSEPTVVFRDGDFDDLALRDTRVLRDEVEQSIRSSGFGDLEKIAAVVLETDGTLSVVAVEQCATRTALPRT